MYADSRARPHSVSPARNASMGSRMSGNTTVAAALCASAAMSASTCAPAPTAMMMVASEVATEVDAVAGRYAGELHLGHEVDLVLRPSVHLSVSTLTAALRAARSMDPGGCKAVPMVAPSTATATCG